MQSGSASRVSSCFQPDPGARSQSRWADLGREKADRHQESEADASLLWGLCESGASHEVWSGAPPAPAMPWVPPELVLQKQADPARGRVGTTLGGGEDGMRGNEGPPWRLAPAPCP